MASCFPVSMKAFRVSNFIRIFYRNFCCSESWRFLRSYSVNTKMFCIIFLSSTEPVFRNFSTITFAVFFYGTPGVEYSLQAIQQHIFPPWHTPCKSAANEHVFQGKTYTDRWIKRDQLDVNRFIISLFTAQHVSDVNTSILRSLRLIWWVNAWVVLFWFDVCWCYVVVWLGWCGIRMQAEALLQLQPASEYHTTTT